MTNPIVKCSNFVKEFEYPVLACCTGTKGLKVLFFSSNAGVVVEIPPNYTDHKINQLVPNLTPITDPRWVIMDRSRVVFKTGSLRKRIPK